MEAHSLKGCCMAFRRRLFDTIDSRLKGTITYRWEDDVCFAVCRNGGRLIYDPTLRVDHFPTKPADHFDDPEVLYISNHNTIYLMLKHNSAFRGGLFLSYSFLLGDYDAYGLAAFLREWLRRKDASFWHQFVPTFSGKIAGLWSFWGGGVRKRRVA
jgi:GT2 family glycosyltransferase